MSLNSVNWSRVMIQVAHFFYAYLELSGLGAEPGPGAEPNLGAEPGPEPGALPELEVVVPTGGAGNIAGGFKVFGSGPTEPPAPVSFPHS